MKYCFPTITHIDEVKSVIQGRNEFVVAEREHYIVVNYVVTTPDTFPPVHTAGGSEKMRVEKSREKAILRECRGLVFAKDGTILSRRLHKFFNIAERDETLPSKIDLSEPHVILEKLDGSMITPIRIGDSFRWGTKMGITDTSMNAEEFIAARPLYTEFAEFCHDLNMTPIFEWCSRKNRIVVDYPEDRLVLVAIRDTITGEYMPYDNMAGIGRLYAIDVVKTYPGTPESMEHLIQSTSETEGIEGWIIRFDDGHMVKIKGDWYVRIHKTKDNLNFEKNIIDLIVTEKIDDAKAFMPDEDRERVVDFELAFWAGFTSNFLRISALLQNLKSKYHNDKKQFAINEAPHMDGLIRRILFSCWDGSRDVRTEMLNIIKSHTGTQSQIDSVRALWGGTLWN